VTNLTLEMQAGMAELLTWFKLPTFAAEVVRRFSEAGHADALPTLLEVLEAEARVAGSRRSTREIE
jgi:hypothetical protein